VRASVTPLASILGSGLLIIVPVLERTLGSLSLFGAAGVCAVAWVVGTSVRHCVRVVEPALASGSPDRVNARLDRAGDAVIVVAYVISVALYLRIMAQYVISYADPGASGLWDRVLACAAVALIVVVGITRGFAGLNLLDRVSLAVVLTLTTLLGGTLLLHDTRGLSGSGLALPPVPHVGISTVLRVLGGIVITVQGFETVQYLGDRYDAETRVWASRLAQLVSASIYLGFVAVATPVMGLGTAKGPDGTLLDITARVAPWLALPLVLSAVLSQFSAAVADTVAAEGNLRGLSRFMRGPTTYLVSGGAAVLLAATAPTFTIVAVASRAFAAYYAIQAALAMRTSTSRTRKAGYGALSIVMVAVTLFAQAAS